MACGLTRCFEIIGALVGGIAQGAILGWGASTENFAGTIVPCIFYFIILANTFATC
jgi:hypothetical protein